MQIKKKKILLCKKTPAGNKKLWQNEERKDITYPSEHAQSHFRIKRAASVEKNGDWVADRKPMLICSHDTPIHTELFFKEIKNK